MIPQSPEAVAKAALLSLLRGAGELRTRTIISELAVEKWARRADIVTVGTQLVAYEVKSKADRLTRLEDQLQAYSSVFDRVYAVVATKHMNAVMSRVPTYIGLKELVQTSRGVEARHVREALLSPGITPEASLNLLPVVELAKLIRLSGGGPCAGQSREALLGRTDAIPLDVVRAHVRDYLRAKHTASTHAFLGAAAGRRIRPEDLVHLSVWQKVESLARPVPDPVAVWLAALSTEGAFGPVPSDVRELLASA